MQNFIYKKGIKVRRLIGLSFLIDICGKFQVKIDLPYYRKSEIDNKWRWELSEPFAFVCEKFGKIGISLLYCGFDIVWNLEQQYRIMVV